MSEAQELYEHAIKTTGIDDPAEALDSLLASYGDEYRENNHSNKVKFCHIFQIGDDVQLQSGDKVMTIKEVKDEIIVCEWLNENNEIKTDKFHCNKLTFIEELYDENIQIGYTENKNIPIIEINEDEIPF